MRLRSQRIVASDGVVGGEVVVRDGVIDSVNATGSGSQAGLSGEPIELEDRWLVPGFIDVHVHGGGGAQFNTLDVDEVLTAARFHARHGTTGLLATTVAAGVDELVGAMETVLVAMEASGGVADGAGLLGVHLEGPFLSRARPGAMDPGVFLDVDEMVVDRLLDAGGGSGGGRVRVMTLAPELPGAQSLIERLSRSGIVCSLGHSDASYDQARAAVEAGARSATHVFNAMPALHHRAPGLLGAVLDLSQVDCELVCDGIHVDPAAMRLVRRAKGVEGFHLVTDAMAAAGMADGEYRLGGARVVVSDGRAVLAGGDSIAGSTLTMDVAFANVVSSLGLSVEEAVRVTSRNPAALLGLGDRKGSIAAGIDADLVVLDDELAVCGTMIGGEWVDGRPPAP
ncbi:MAG: N-acetylglucosamine-6-phosphate deacetylase [Solirubrobacteraceae bacterium]